jgi:hypothetical protein
MPWNPRRVRRGFHVGSSSRPLLCPGYAGKYEGEQRRKTRPWTPLQPTEKTACVDAVRAANFGRDQEGARNRTEVRRARAMQSSAEKLKADLKTGPSPTEDVGWPRKEERRALPTQGQER